MKIQYKKKRLNTYLIIGIVWGIFGLLTLAYDGLMRWANFGYIVMSLLYFGQYVYEYKNQYLTIENGIIRKNRFFGNKLDLNQITWIKKFAGDYILKTDEQELTIHTEWIDEKSMVDLIHILSELKLPPEKTPFANNGYRK